MVHGNAPAPRGYLGEAVWYLEHNGLLLAELLLLCPTSAHCSLPTACNGLPLEPSLLAGFRTLSVIRCFYCFTKRNKKQKHNLLQDTLWASSDAFWSFWASGAVPTVIAAVAEGEKAAKVSRANAAATAAFADTAGSTPKQQDGSCWWWRR
jgi:hypothetical protein